MYATRVAYRQGSPTPYDPSRMLASRDRQPHASMDKAPRPLSVPKDTEVPGHLPVTGDLSSMSGLARLGTREDLIVRTTSSRAHTGEGAVCTSSSTTRKEARDQVALGKCALPPLTNQEVVGVVVAPEDPKDPRTSRAPRGCSR